MRSRRRVGIIRRLRWNATLKRDAPGAYRLDMTVARFKNARFFGPSVTSISSMIAPYLDAYVDLVQFDWETQPYVFCTRDPTYCRASSDWTSYCKGIFQRWSGIACPPKMLRASYIVRRATLHSRPLSLCRSPPTHLSLSTDVAPQQHRLSRGVEGGRARVSPSAQDARK